MARPVAVSRAGSATPRRSPTRIVCDDSTVAMNRTHRPVRTASWTVSPVSAQIDDMIGRSRRLYSPVGLFSTAATYSDGPGRYL